MARKGVARKEPTDTLKKISESFGAAWKDNQRNPAIDLLSCESHLCARVNFFNAGKWSSVRCGDDEVRLVVQLADGKEETRRFTRGVLDAEWRSC